MQETTPLIKQRRLIWHQAYGLTFTNREKPVGVYNVIDPPKKEEISDIIQWNKKHGIIWIVYGICIELGFWIGYVMPSEEPEIFFMIGGIVIPLPFMCLRHHKLEKVYRINQLDIY